MKITINGATPMDRLTNLRAAYSQVTSVHHLFPRSHFTQSLGKLGEYQGTIGWGYCDFLGDIAAKYKVERAVPIGRDVDTRSNRRCTRRPLV